MMVFDDFFFFFFLEHGLLPADPPPPMDRRQKPYKYNGFGARDAPNVVNIMVLDNAFL